MKSRMKSARSEIFIDLPCEDDDYHETKKKLILIFKSYRLKFKKNKIFMAKKKTMYNLFI